MSPDFASSLTLARPHSLGRLSVLDGIKGKDYPRYFFDKVSSDIRALFCDACDRLGIAYSRPLWKTVSIARAGSVARLDSFVGPKS